MKAISLDERQMIACYVNQFGPAKQMKGKEYLKEILAYYLESGSTADFSKILKQMGQKLDCDPKTLHKAITRYVEIGWENGFDWAWRRSLGWSGTRPPHPSEAIHILCQQYASFLRTFEPLLAHSSSWYLRPAVEKLDAEREGAANRV